MSFLDPVRAANEEMDRRGVAAEVFAAAVQDESENLRLAGGRQFVFGWVNDPSGDLADLADITFTNYHDEVEIGRLVKAYFRKRLEGAARHVAGQ